MSASRAARPAVAGGERQHVQAPSSVVHRGRAGLWNLAVFAVAWLVALGFVAVTTHASPALRDARVYWEAWHGPVYAGGFVYPSAGALLFVPAAILPWPAFAALWTGILVVSGAWLLWPLPMRLRLPLLVALAATFAWGNAATLLAVALALAVRWPAAWAALAWTKVTPAVGLVALVRQRRWRDLGVAVGLCAAVGVAVLVLASGAIGDWLAQLMRHPEIPSYYLAVLPFVPPLWARLALAAAVAWWGASRPWTLVVAAALATPDLSVATCGLLAAAPRLLQHERMAPAVPLSGGTATEFPKVG